MNFPLLKKTDAQLFRLIQKEIIRQKQTIDLIASENFLKF
jgi:glycine/serine hydroxymethyltransferase